MQSSDTAGIDLDFRPSSYFWPLGLEKHLLARIKGAERKAALQRLIDAGRLDDIPEYLAQSALSSDERQMLGRIHPAFMGGEYLPNLMANEVMVARVTIASTTQDVTCVYARRGKNRVHYRVVDEYGGDTLSGRTTRTSTRPLKLGDLTSFFLVAWPIFDVLEMNFGDSGYDLDELQGFIVGAESVFYPGFEALYRRRVREWAATKSRVVGMNQVPDDHWIYDEGASITFIAPTPGPGSLISRPRKAAPGVAKGVGKLRPNATATRLLEALCEAMRGNEAMSGDDVPDVIELEDGEEVEWVASTYAHEQLINLFVCRAAGEPETLLATEHGDRGVLQSVDGPWGSVEAAKASYGPVPEGWSDL